MSVFCGLAVCYSWEEAGDPLGECGGKQIDVSMIPKKSTNVLRLILQALFIDNYAVSVMAALVSMRYVLLVHLLG